MPVAGYIGAAAAKQKPIASMKKGGMVKKTGLYRLHAGEMVMPSGMVKKMADKMKAKK